MDEADNKFIIFFGIAIMIVSIAFLLYGIYNLGAKTMCEDSGGVLLEKEGDFQCIDVENLDLCINIDNIIQEKEIDYRSIGE